MAASRSALDTAWRIGLALEGVEDSTYFGLPALKRNGRMVACLAGHRSAEPDSLIVPVASFERRDELLASDPEVFYVKPHYLQAPVVLVRLHAVAVPILRDLLAESCRMAAAAPPPRARRSPGARGTPRRRR